MLTIHKYKNLGKDWDKEKIADCCKSDTTEDPKCGDCCYDTWTDELKQVNKKFSEKKEEAEQLQKRLSFLTGRRDKFKTWLAELEAAQQMAKKICHQLELIAAHSDKIWSNTQLAVKAIHILFCMIRDFFLQLDYLKKRYDELQVCISKNTDPSLVKGQGILKCLDDYYAKLDALIKLRDEIIKAAVEAVRISNILRNDISTREWHWKYIPCETKYDPCNHQHKPCPDWNDDHVSYGFKTIICEWYKFFNCDERCGCDDNQKRQKKHQKGNGGSPDKNEYCSDHCYLDTFSFPICNDDYRECIEKRFEKDDTCVKELAEDLREVNKSKEALQACKGSLEAAIKEADPKARCK